MQQDSGNPPLRLLDSECSARSEQIHAEVKLQLAALIVRYIVWHILHKLTPPIKGGNFTHPTQNLSSFKGGYHAFDSLMQSLSHYKG